jgi:hypothetical protein
LTLKPAYRRAARDGLIVAGLGYFLIRFGVLAPLDGHVGFDAFAYWSLDPSRPYDLPNSALGAFLYSPPLVRVFAPAALLSWTQFWFLWTAVLLATVLWLGGRRAAWLLAFPPVALELYYGNINLLIAAAIALGFRYPAAWAFVLLAKVTPGIGLLWYAVRGEWRSLAVALGSTGLIVAVSFAIDGSLWPQWIAAVQRDANSNLGGVLAIPLWLRLPAAAAIVSWGARANRPWTVPVGATVAMPVLWVAVFSTLSALPAVHRLYQGSPTAASSS